MRLKPRGGEREKKKEGDRESLLANEEVNGIQQTEEELQAEAEERIRR